MRFGRSYITGNLPYRQVVASLIDTAYILIYATNTRYARSQSILTAGSGALSVLRWKPELAEKGHETEIEDWGGRVDCFGGAGGAGPP